MPLTIGITGGIGSGKTTVCMIFEALGIPVYNADVNAKRLMNSDINLKTAITEYFGSDIYSGGNVDRGKLAAIVFNDKSALQKLNSMVHPAVASDFERWRNRQTAHYVLEESAIIFENNLSGRFDRIILVTASEEQRVARVRSRDGISKEMVLKRMTNQLPEEEKIKHAHYIICNENNSMVIPQIIEIDRKIRNLCRF